MRRIMLPISVLCMSACMQSSPYELKSNSSPLADLSNSSITAANGKSYRTSGYIEMFAPNYFVIVGAPDNRALADDFQGASSAASAAVRKFDCKNGTELRDGSRYSKASNEWLVVIDCRSGGRSLTGS